MAKLITESSFEVICESANDGKDFYVSGIFSTADVRVANGRTYPRTILEREAKKLMESSIRDKNCYGELEHPLNRPNTLLERAAILIENLDWRGNDLVGKAYVLDTPMGNTLKGIMKRGKVGISSRGLGTVSEAGLVENSFNLLSYDIVSNASNPNSKVINGIYEGQEFYTSEEMKSGLITEEDNKEKLILEAKKEHTKKVWQVLKQIEKNWI